MPEQTRERDLVLSPNEFIHILDETKGNINTYVGPNKASLGNTEKPVLFDEKSKRFQPCTLDSGIQQFKTAPEGWYVILKNPAAGDKRPQSGKAEVLIDLQVGRKINIPGPISFPLWPGQMAKVVKGHHIRSNEYLVGRVYDDEAARKNWASAVVKTTNLVSVEKDTVGTGAITMGQQIIIKGTEVAFFIPPTGIEITPDDENKYVRQAVTLERLEYCILLDEDGNKRFVKGPDVVFPKPTETFLKRKNEDGKVTRKFRAIELNPQMGIYIKVIAPYEEGVEKFTAGDELFLTGNEVKIYYPRPEHAIMRYGDGNEIHYSVAIPAGEGRYLMNKPTGAINTVKGPSMLLADPRSSVIVNRVLNQNLCQLMYPGNKEALQHNTALAQMMGEDGVEKMLRESQYSSRLYTMGSSSVEMNALGLVPKAMADEDEPNTGGRQDRGAVLRSRKALVADDFSRKTAYTPPRSITLNTKFQGAVQMTIWTGYAVQLVSKSGSRKVVVGPQSVILDYDESPEVIKLSRGKPKGTEGVKEDIYLRIHNNKISDRVEAETSDMVKVQVDLSYRVNFEGEDPSKWFEVEDYVKYLCDHARSMIRNAVKKIRVEDFNVNPIDLIRDTILGVQIANSRSGRAFTENNMRIYDVEVLDITIGDKVIGDLLMRTQHNVVSTALQLADSQRQLEVQIQMEEIAQELEQEKAKTRLAKLQIAQTEAKAAAQVDKDKVNDVNALEQLKLNFQVDKQTQLDQINTAELARVKAKAIQDFEVAEKNINLNLEGLKAQSAARVDEAQAIQPGLVEALQANANVALLGKAYENLAPLAVVGNKTVVELLQDLVKGTKLESLLGGKK